MTGVRDEGPPADYDWLKGNDLGGCDCNYNSIHSKIVNLPVIGEVDYHSTQKLTQCISYYPILKSNSEPRKLIKLPYDLCRLCESWQYLRITSIHPLDSIVAMVILLLNDIFWLIIRVSKWHIMWIFQLLIHEWQFLLLFQTALSYKLLFLQSSNLEID